MFPPLSRHLTDETKLIDIWQLFRITALIMLARIMNLLKSGTIPYPISISEEERGYLIQHSFRACLKNAFCKMCVTICGRFRLNEGGVAGYVNRMKAKYTANWGVQVAGMIFQTRSSISINRKL